MSAVKGCPPRRPCSGASVITAVLCAASIRQGSELRSDVARSGRCRVGVVLLAGLMLAACSSPPPHSLANDQRAVDAAQAAVARDQQAMSVYTHPSQAQAISCAVTASTSGANTSPGCPGSVVESKDQANLKVDHFKLQVAQDQLKKDESGGGTGITIPKYQPPTTTTTPVNCGALPVGPGAGPPPAACPGLP
jgi:hypothetical protein